MGTLNKIMLIGRLGADPELKFVGSKGIPLCTMRVATDEQWTDKATGERKESTEWHRVNVWNDQANSCAKHLVKGREVYVEGRLKTRSYDKNGQKHYATDVVADRVVFLGSGKMAPHPGDEPEPAQRELPTGGLDHPADDDSDVPF